MSDLRRARDSTDPEVLLELARSTTDKRVRRALAGNPNAPWDALRPLLATHPVEVLDNPALPLLLLSDPSLLSRLTVASLRGLSTARTRLGELLGWTEELPWTELQWTLMCVASARHRLPLSDRYQPKLSYLRRFLVERRLLPDDIELRLTADPSKEVRRALSRTSKFEQVIESLLEGETNHRALAVNPHLPTCYQWALASIGDVSIRLELARNRGVSESVLEKLASDPSVPVRAAVALAGGTSQPVWERLCWDSEPSVQAAARRASRAGANP